MNPLRYYRHYPHLQKVRKSFIQFVFMRNKIPRHTVNILFIIDIRYFLYNVRACMRACVCILAHRSALHAVDVLRVSDAAVRDRELYRRGPGGYGKR